MVDMLRKCLRICAPLPGPDEAGWGWRQREHSEKVPFTKSVHLGGNGGHGFRHGWHSQPRWVPGLLLGAASAQVRAECHVAACLTLTLTLPPDLWPRLLRQGLAHHQAAPAPTPGGLTLTWAQNGGNWLLDQCSDNLISPFV